jgi:anti-sigma B factor antagonist
VSDLETTVRTSAGATVLELAGELDYASAAGVRAALQPVTLSPGDLLVIDLGALTFCDSTGISALIAAHHRVLAAGGRLALSAVPGRVARVFGIVGLDQLFTTHPTTAQALASAGAGEDPVSG